MTDFSEYDEPHRFPEGPALTEAEADEHLREMAHELNQYRLIKHLPALSPQEIADRLGVDLERLTRVFSLTALQDQIVQSAVDSIRYAPPRSVIIERTPAAQAAFAESMRRGWLSGRPAERAIIEADDFRFAVPPAAPTAPSYPAGTREALMSGTTFKLLRSRLMTRSGYVSVFAKEHWFGCPIVIDSRVPDGDCWFIPPLPRHEYRPTPHEVLHPPLQLTPGQKSTLRKIQDPPRRRPLRALARVPGRAWRFIRRNPSLSLALALCGALLAAGVVLS